MTDFGLFKAETVIKIGLAVKNKDAVLAREVRDDINTMFKDPDAKEHPDFDSMMYEIRLTTEDTIIRLISREGTQVDDEMESVIKALNNSLEPETDACLQFILDADRNIGNHDALKKVTETFTMSIIKMDKPPNNMLFRQAISTLAGLALLYLKEEDQLKILSKIQEFKKIL